MTDTLRQFLAQQPRAEYTVHGEWHNIRLRPDLATGEVLNIGIALRLPDGRLTYRLLEDAKRLTCLYGEGIEEDTLALIASLRQKLANGELATPSPNIIFSEAKTVNAADEAELLDQLFDETVTLSRPDGKVDDTAFASMSTEKVRKLVFDVLRQSTGMKADKIIGQNSVIEVRDGAKTHHLDIPIQGNDFLGSVISGWYKSPVSVERNIMRADLALGAARQVFHKDRIGLFILRPGAGQIPSPALIKLDNTIDKLEWLIRSQGLTLGVRETEDDLAGEIASWAEI